MRIKKYLSPAGALNKRYTDKDFEGTGWHYIPRSDIKPDDKLLGTALKLGEEYYLAGEDGYLLPSNIVNDFLKNKDLNNYFTLQYDANDRIGQLMRLRAADRKANQLTPGAGTFVVAPVAATLAGIGGATLAPFLAPGTIGGNIIGTTAFGEALNQAMKYGTGKTLGEHAVNAAHYLGIPLSQWGDFGILMVGDLPFYVTGDLVGKQVANAGRTLTKEALDQLALDNTFKGIPINPTTKDLAKAINESVDKQSLYTPSILHKFDNPYQITKVSGDKIRLRLPSHTQEKPREVVLVPHGNNLYELHIRTWDGDHVPANLNPQEKTALFESVYNELPEGAEILFPESSADYPATRGTVAALTHLSRDPRFQRGNTTGTLTYTDKDGNLQTFTGNSFIKGEKPLNSHSLGEAYLKDSFGKEITSTPFPGTDNELSQMAYDSQIDVLKDYFTNPQKIEQVKSEMHWGDKEYDEFLDELMRILGTQADVNIRDLQSGFTDIGSSSGKVIGEGTNAEARQKLSLNKDRIANVELALETIIHEIGGHGKTLSIRLNPNDVVSTKFGKWFPRMKLFTRKNKTIADTTLELNEKGKLFSDFDSENALKHYLKWNNYSPSEINDLLEQYRHFKYATDEQELYARGYTSLLMLNLKPTYKTLNLELLERYYTPESVKKYINSVLSISVPIIGSYGLIQSNRKGGKLIPRKYGIGGYVTDLLGLNKEGSFLTKASSKLGELALKAEKPLSYLNVLSPTSVVGAVGRKIMGNPEPIMNLIRKGTGITTSAFSEAHPIASLALNLGLDFVTDPFTLVGSVGKINQAGKIGKAAVQVANKTEMLTHLSKLLTTSAVTPERQRLWKCLMYITNGRPSEGFKLAKARLSGDELSDMLKYILTGDAQAFSRLKPGFTGFIEKGRKPELWYERYTTASPSSNEIELTDLTLGIVDSKVNVPALYEQLSKASPLLSKDLAISIRGGEIIGTKQAIKNQGLLKMLNGEDVPLGIIPIVADNYLSGVRALQRLNNETPIMSYSLRTHLIKTAKRGQEGMFNTGGMHCYIYADEKGKLRLVEADIFKNTASGITKKYSGIFGGSSIKEIGKRIALNRYNGAEQTGVVILREKRLETNDLINAIALLEKRIYEGRSALKRGDITENDFLALRAETSKTENLLREMLIQQNPKYYLLNLTEINSQSRKLIGKPDKKGHWVTSEDAHIESTVDKIMETLGSKHEQTRLSTDRNRIKKIVTQAMEIGENQSKLKRAMFTSLIETPETVNPRLKAIFRTIEPEKYAKAAKLNRARKFSNSPQDNIVFLFSEGKTYVPRTLDFSSKNNVDNQIKNTIYAIQNYNVTDPNSRELITKAIDEGFTLFDPEKMKSPETFYNTLKECKQLFSDKLSELIPNVDKKINSNLHRSQKLIAELPNILKCGGKINSKNIIINEY